MKNKTLLSLGCSVLLIGGLAWLIPACSKQGNSKLLADIATQKDALRSQVTGHSYTVPVNQKLTATFSDQDGNPLSQERLRAHQPPRAVKGATITSACDYSNSPTVTFNSYTILLDCINGYTVSWNYTVVTNNNLVATNATTGLTSKGRFYMYNSAGSLLYSATTLVATITDLGANSLAGYENYSVTFTTGAIPTSNFQAAYTTNLGALLVSDCPDNEPVTVALQPYSATNFQFPTTNPCARVDPWYFNNAAPPYRIWGEDVLGTCGGSGMSFPNLQEINFSIDGGTWLGDANTPSSYITYYGLPNFGAGPNFATLQMSYIDVGGALIVQITPPTGTHTIAFRSRNILYNGPASSFGGTYPVPNPGVNCCAGPWGPIKKYTYTY